MVSITGSCAQVSWPKFGKGASMIHFELKWRSMRSYEALARSERPAVISMETASGLCAQFTQTEVHMQRLYEFLACEWQQNMAPRCRRRTSPEVSQHCTRLLCRPYPSVYPRSILENSPVRNTIMNTNPRTCPMLAYTIGSLTITEAYPRPVPSHHVEPSGHSMSSYPPPFPVYYVIACRETYRIPSQHNSANTVCNDYQT